MGVVEKVARAHFAALVGICNNDGITIEPDGIRAARAAIAELADNITDEMVVEMASADDCAYSAPHETNYRAMFIAAIRAALKE